MDLLIIPYINNTKLIGLQTIRSKMAVEIVNRKVVGISAQIKGLHYFGIFRAFVC